MGGAAGLGFVDLDGAFDGIALGGWAELTGDIVALEFAGLDAFEAAAATG